MTVFSVESTILLVQIKVPTSTRKIGVLIYLFLIQPQTRILISTDRDLDITICTKSMNNCTYDYVKIDVEQILFF